MTYRYPHTVTPTYDIKFLYHATRPTVMFKISVFIVGQFSMYNNHLKSVVSMHSTFRKNCNPKYWGIASYSKQRQLPVTAFRDSPYNEDSVCVVCEPGRAVAQTLGRRRVTAEVRVLSCLTEWHRGRVFYKYFGFILLVSFRQLSLPLLSY